jgi:hypothetical protein
MHNCSLKYGPLQLHYGFLPFALRFGTADELYCFVAGCKTVRDVSFHQK